MNEIANALSMLVPMLTMTYLGATDWRPYFGVFALGVALVVGNSCFYHVARSFRAAEPLCVVARKMDQSSQHACSALFVCAISDSVVYAGVTVVCAAAGIGMLWLPGAHDVMLVRRASIVVTAFMVVGAIALRRDYANCVGSSLSVAAAMCFFALGGYYQALSHFLLAPFMFFVHRALKKE